VAGYGNEPTNWIAAAPTPGQAAGSGDSDGDGMPDAWELANGTFVFIPDGNDDPDQDGFTNDQEYLAGTHPNDPSSGLRFTRISVQTDGAVLQFMAVSNRTYSVLFKTSLLDACWSKGSDLVAGPGSRLGDITNSNAANGATFYRLVTPMQP
jgi:hypothetical protein